MKCLRCGSSQQVNYCESCIQELITRNMELQLTIRNLERHLSSKEKHKPKHMK